MPHYQPRWGDISALTGDYAITMNIDYVGNSYITISNIKLK